MKLEFLQAGQVVAVHGLRGEVKVLPWADDPAFLQQFSRVRISGKEYAVDTCRVQKTCNLLKLRGVDTVEDGQALRGKTVEIYRCDAPEDAVFAAELMGMTVLENGRELGRIADVLDYPGNKVYVVRGEHEYLIPAVKEFVTSIDVAQNQMQVKLIEGMRSDEN